MKLLYSWGVHVKKKCSGYIFGLCVLLLMCNIVQSGKITKTPSQVYNVYSFLLVFVVVKLHGDCNVESVVLENSYTVSTQ